MVELTNVQAIKQYFGLDSATTMAEVRKMTPEEREWFGSESRRVLAEEAAAK